MYASLLAVILKVIRNIRGTHTVDDIVADFTKKFEKLHVAATLHGAQIQVHDEAIKLAEEAKAFVIKEQARARIIADKIKALVD